MVFSSITFLYYFLPIVILLYLIAPKTWKNYVLLLMSLVFYGWGGPKYLVLMGLSLVVNYIMGLLIEKYENTPWSKLWISISLVFSFGTLGYFKYMNFFIENMNGFFKTSYEVQHIVLPIGISFYTFQILSYTIDVYRKNTKAQKNPFYLATYVVFFPQLIAGPIVRYTDIVDKLEHRSHSFDQICEGMKRFFIGLMKKVLLANTLGELCSIFHDTSEKSILFYWMYGIAFTLQIYFDFSGYSDMAIGMGKFFGFEFLENFNYPLISRSITEFWRRWHMSLGTWFRDYVYIPLGGNRVSKSRWLFNILVVWLLTGLWHGAAWNFIVWGLLFAVILILEKLWLGRVLSIVPRIFSHLYVIILVVISFVIFDAPSMAIAIENIGSMFGRGGIPVVNLQTLYYARSYFGVFLIGIIASTQIPSTMINHMKNMVYGERVIRIFEPVIFLLFLLITTAYLVDASFNPFLYFRF